MLFVIVYFIRLAFNFRASKSGRHVYNFRELPVSQVKMAPGEHFCLKWNDFESNISQAFGSLRQDEDFFDVTLACEDDCQVSAHKLILSACSPFFRSVLKKNPHQHPLLFLRGVKMSELSAVLNFMYHGEVNVSQDSLNQFLVVAEDLQVKGLTKAHTSAGGGDTKQTTTSSQGRSTLEPPKKKLKVKSPPSGIKQAAKQEQKEEKVESNEAGGAEDEIEIQEVLPVKTEQADYRQAAIVEGPSDGGEEAAVEEYDESGYDQFGQYDEEDETGYDLGAATVAGDYTGSISDGNKGKDEILHLYKARNF